MHRDIEAGLALLHRVVAGARQQQVLAGVHRIGRLQAIGLGNQDAGNFRARGNSAQRLAIGDQMLGLVFRAEGLGLAGRLGGLGSLVRHKVCRSGASQRHGSQTKRHGPHQPNRPFSEASAASWVRSSWSGVTEI